MRAKIIANCYNLEATGVGCVNLGLGDPSLSYTNSVWNCAKELAGGSQLDGQNRGTEEDLCGD